jgi:Protein kinase domain/PEGA domain
MRSPWHRFARPLLFSLVVAVCGSAAAEEWHEAYRSGVRALSQGDARAAVSSLRRAIALRPEPGRNVVTYGTNFEPRYFPYLRLAEACLALGDLDAAREALEASVARAGEPAEERKALEARLASAQEARRPPPTTLAASPTPSLAELPRPPVAAPPVAAPTPTPIPTPLPSAAPATPASSAPAATPTAPPRPVPIPPAAGAAPPSLPAAAPEAGSVEIVSDPKGALAFVDDEPLGPTDPETGRLVKGSLAPGRHRVRVSHAGYEDVVREVDVEAARQATFEARLPPRPASNAPGLAWLVFGLVALALVGAVAWTVLRRPSAAAPVWQATPLPTTPPLLEPRTPSGHVNPGARRDARGEEWFGDFRLLGMLGRGGMASVYKAELRGEVSALKRPLSSFLDDPDFIARFLREADIGRTLNHPNIVRILTRGHVDAVPYFTMELLAGETLLGFLAAQGPAAPRHVTNLVVQVAEALDFAHSKGVVHRDLKPSNIMLLSDGTAKVMDFGIARAVRFEGLTATGAFLGTPDYVAPEIVEGGVADARSDLYSLGALYYELLAGARPFTGDSAFAILRKHCSEAARPPSALNPAIPPELDALVLRLLAKAPGDRLESAEALVVALRDWLNRTA